MAATGIPLPRGTGPPKESVSRMERTAVRLILSLLLLMLAACHRETEEDRVRKVIGTVQQAAEEKKVRAVLEHLSLSYQDAQGYDREGIKGLLVLYFFRHQAVSVSLPALDVTVAGAEARAVFQAILTGREGGGPAPAILPDALGVYDFDVSFRKEGDAWKIVSATWQRAGEGAGPPQR